MTTITAEEIQKINSEKYAAALMKVAWRFYNSKHNSTCCFCHTSIDIGSRIGWGSSGAMKFTAHWHCCAGISPIEARRYADKKDG